MLHSQWDHGTAQSLHEINLDMHCKKCLVITTQGVVKSVSVRPFCKDIHIPLHVIM